MRALLPVAPPLSQRDEQPFRRIEGVGAQFGAVCHDDHDDLHEPPGVDELQDVVADPDESIDCAKVAFWDAIEAARSRVPSDDWVSWKRLDAIENAYLACCKVDSIDADLCSSFIDAIGT